MSFGAALGLQVFRESEGGSILNVEICSFPNWFSYSHWKRVLQFRKHKSDFRTSFKTHPSVLAEPPLHSVVASQVSQTVHQAIDIFPRDHQHASSIPQVTDPQHVVVYREVEEPSTVTSTPPSKSPRRREVRGLQPHLLCSLLGKWCDGNSLLYPVGQESDEFARFHSTPSSHRGFVLLNESRIA